MFDLDPINITTIDFKKHVILNKCPITKIKWYSNNYKKYHDTALTIKDLYYSKCKFTFSLTDYPDEFDFELLKKYGMYSTPGSNKSNIYNPNDAVEIIVSYGFQNDIDPYFISHPANCQLIQHKNNNIKNTNCSITFDELKKKIEIWNEKHGKCGTYCPLF